MSTIQILQEQTRILQNSILFQQKFNRRMVKALAKQPQFIEHTALMNKVTTILCPSLIENPLDSKMPAVSVAEFTRLLGNLDPSHVHDEQHIVALANALASWRSMLTTEVMAVVNQIEDEKVARYWLDAQIEHIEDVQTQMHAVTNGGQR